MPGSTGVQPFKRKQREEGKGRIETAEGQQKRSVYPNFDVDERRQTGKAFTRRNKAITLSHRCYSGSPERRAISWEKQNVRAKDRTARDGYRFPNRGMRAGAEPASPTLGIW